MTVIRDAWQELWQRNRGGGFLTLAFWYTLITTAYEYIVVSRIGPSMPKSLQQLFTNPAATPVMPHLAPQLVVRVVLAYLTFLLIVVPFSLGGLYGGIAYALKERPAFTNFLAFFRFGYLNFWRALTQIVLSILYAIVMVLALSLILLGLSHVLGAVGSVVWFILLILVMLWLVATVLYWFGYTFTSGESPRPGFLLAIRWGWGHLGQLYSQTILLVGLLLATVIVVETFVRMVPFLGELLVIFVLGMVVPAFLAIYALMLFQRTASRS